MTTNQSQEKEIRSIPLSKSLLLRADKLIDPIKGIYFSDLVEEALEMYVGQVEIAFLSNPENIKPILEVKHSHNSDAFCLVCMEHPCKLMENPLIDEGTK